MLSFYSHVYRKTYHAEYQASNTFRGFCKINMRYCCSFCFIFCNKKIKLQLIKSLSLINTSKKPLNSLNTPIAQFLGEYSRPFISFLIEILYWLNIALFRSDIQVFKISRTRSGLSGHERLFVTSQLTSVLKSGSMACAVFQIVLVVKKNLYRATALQE